TSSYSYPLYASLTVNSYLTSGEGNKKWWDQILRLGIEWRKELIRKSKLFKPLVIDNFENISTDELSTNEKYWNLDSTNLWHGFSKIATGQGKIETIKITILTSEIDVKNAKYK